MIPFADSKNVNPMNDVLDTLDRWYIAASSDGCLWIQPRRAELTLLDFCTLVKRIHRMFNDHRFEVVIFHFDGIQAPRSVWTIVLRLLTALAKSVQTDCRVIRSIKVNGQPPAGSDRGGNVEGPANRIETARRTIHLNGVSVVMEPRTLDGPVSVPDARSGF